ncbi:GGDEF domain-containing protein [Ruminiclostridium cellulolyticum]|uniref:Diguanylate cyclase n=1 Tax=Ruminiclostridium cellulolyticum (strain ATCC 35319 / DSM 5812 / JCM 6584 / H10) TaxID=394503 RepID=B8I5B8_RUMCH|nr:diguanylate cyclase [Ruminiclostridium cellulolyticum]ACL76654.1 diguanylate cyclase [Ruminiclostridium cellulolyticum H10]
MLRDLIANAAILISFLSIANQLYKDKEIVSRPIFKILAGGVCGILGILLMCYSVHIQNKILVDFRNIATLLAATIGGLSAIISGLVMGAFRIAYFGLDKYSATGAFLILVVTAGIILIFKTQRPLGRKWLISTIYITVLSCGVYFYTFKNDFSILLSISPYFILGTFIVSYTVYKYMIYLNNMRALFKKLKEESTKDYLTGLNNVREFDKLFRLVIDRAVSNNHKFSLLLIDIDFFKKINDTHGHQAGDKVLKEIGKILRHNCRANDKISRNGGEEFSILLENASNSKAIEIAERIRRIIEENEFEITSGRKINVTVSIGISSYPETVSDITQIIERADGALYKAKRSGRNLVVTDSVISDNL